MKITFLPKTYLGKWSVILSIVSFILFIVGSVLPSKSGYSGFEIIIKNPLQTVITVLIFAAGITGSVMGLVSVIKKREHSALVYLNIPLGLYNIISLIGVILTIL